ncbi:MAG: amidase [Bacteroidetes bacterium]|nr:amidase [Bacteroidota bacterium]
MKRYYSVFLLILLVVSFSKGQQNQDEDIYFDTSQAEALFDLNFTKTERDSIQDGLKSNLKRIKALHAFSLENETPPAFIFNPLPVGFKIDDVQKALNFGLPVEVHLPENDTELAFYTIAQLSVLVRDKKVTSTKLTKLYLDRLKKFGDTLECVVTLLEDRALEQAARADEEIAAGNYRGLLHGIPYGIKDLFTLEGYKTTWGAMAYKDQMLGNSATVIHKLDEAGAVLLVKLTLGALAMGDVWYGGKTRNPWNPEQGSSGSSAGSGAATAAGLVAFAIGTETLGSIVSPSTRNGVTGLRPTFGRVSRTGAMALSWTMDKAGPMCRSAQGCAIVLNAIYGPDGMDQAVINAAFNYNADLDIGSLKIGYLKDLFEREYSNRSNDSIALRVFHELGIHPEPVSLPENLPYSAMYMILAAESAAAFDELTRSNNDDLLVRQDKNAWPTFFRGARFIPAVEYIQANRIRYLLIEKMNALFQKYDAIITPSFGGPQLLATNLTGHPAVVLPNGFNEKGSPTSFSIIGRLFQEGTILAIANAYQQATAFETMKPSLFSVN